MRLDLRSTRPDYSVPPVVTAASFEVGESIPARWRFTPEGCARYRTQDQRAKKGPAAGVEVELDPEARLTIRGPFQPESFNRVVLRLALQGKVDVIAKAVAKGELLARSTTTRFVGEGDVGAVVLDLPGLLAAEKGATHVVLTFRRVLRAPIVLGVDLVRVPRAATLPTATEGPRPIQLGEETRSGVGLSSFDPLEARVIGPPQARLEFAYAYPRSVQRPGETLRLKVMVSGGAGEPTSRTIRLHSDEAEPRWRTVGIPLNHVGGEELNVRFELEKIGAEEAVCALASPHLVRRLSTPPTVVLVTSDTHRADHLEGGAGGVRTPFLARLAAEGVIFEDCFAPTNITNPSHASLMTGIPVRDTGILHNNAALSGEATTLAERFQAAGFYTLCALSARHLGHEWSGLGQGFDRAFAPVGEDQIDSSVAIARLEGWVEEARGRPLFIWLHVFDAHTPYDPPQSHRYLYYDREQDPYDPSLPALPKEKRAIWDRRIRDLSYVVAQYRGEITYLDEQLASFFENPRLAKGLIAVTGDHGEHFGSHGVYWLHQGLYPETLAVPLILRGPGCPQGARIAAPVDQLDLGRTLLDLAGLPMVDFPGRNLLLWVEDPEREAPPRFAISSHGHSASVGRGGWFLALNLRRRLEPPVRDEHQVELYYLPEDPTCERDLVDERPELAKELRQVLIEWLADASDSKLSLGEGRQDAEILAQMAALGYTGDTGTTPPAEGEAWFTPRRNNPWDRRFED